MSTTVRYRKKFCAMLIEHGAEGFSFSSFASRLKVHKDIISGWEKAYPEFAEARKLARSNMTAYWEKVAHDACLKSFSFNLFRYIMNNEFDNPGKTPEAEDMDREPSVVILPELRKDYTEIS